ncbi:MAG: hypothetical protein DI556_22940 [Rhodovulum sulfidophilum]|uniref:SIP-like Rossmann fold domain-containing protein n=1 Tax=Rhodovulum sulfidophilum TaxID=35806 RepID=A0A2W5MVU3_RHOSU|nr:MAG: hypothetical protein DI556_22940 [Rhodovulum sulfidophilum]
MPAIARLLSSLPPEARGQVFLEVADAAERQPIVAPPAITVRWIERAAGGRLADSVRAEPWEGQGAWRPFAWVGCEHEDFRALRGDFREIITSYWPGGRGR